jgi:hypothetical protein
MTVGGETVEARRTAKGKKMPLSADQTNAGTRRQRSLTLIIAPSSPSQARMRRAFHVRATVPRRAQQPNGRCREGHARRRCRLFRIVHAHSNEESRRWVGGLTPTHAPTHPLKRGGNCRPRSLAIFCGKHESEVPTSCPVQPASFPSPLWAWAGVGDAKHKGATVEYLTPDLLLGAIFRLRRYLGSA